MKGQTLIEVLVALGTGIVVISAIAVAVITSINNLSYGRNQNSATQYAQEGMEIVRRIRNTNTSFGSYNGEYCLPSGSSSLSSVAGNCSSPIDCAPPNINNTFIRRVCVNQGDSSCNQQGNASTQTTKVTVDVFWSDGKCSAQNPYCHSSSLNSCFVGSSSIQSP